MTDALAQQLRLAALDLALAEADAKFGKLPAKLVAAAEAELTTPRKTKRRAR